MKRSYSSLKKQVTITRYPFLLLFQKTKVEMLWIFVGHNLYILLLTTCLLTCGKRGNMIWWWWYWLFNFQWIPLRKKRQVFTSEFSSSFFCQHVFANWSNQEISQFPLIVDETKIYCLWFVWLQDIRSFFVSLSELVPHIMKLHESFRVEETWTEVKRLHGILLHGKPDFIERKIFNFKN